MFILYLFVLITFSVKEYTSEEKVNSAQEVLSGSLQKDFADFVNIIPFNDLRNLTKYYYASDPAMRNSYNYLRDEGFERIFLSLKTLPLVRKIMTFLSNRGVILGDLAQHFEKLVLTKKDCSETEGM